MTKHSLYRHYDSADVLLYVGLSVDLPSRTARHRATSTWFRTVVLIKIEWFEYKTEAQEAERRAIRDEKPLFNVQHSTTVVMRHPKVGTKAERAKKKLDSLSAAGK